MSTKSSEKLSVHLARILDLIRLLSSEELSAPKIVQRFPQYYIDGESGSRQVRKDIEQLNAFGFEFQTLPRPYRYKLIHNPLAATLTDEQIDALAMLREGFDKKHPIGEVVSQLLTLLTSGLDDEQRERFEQPPILRMSLTTAVNYEAARPLFPLIRRAIQRNNQIRFAYYSLDQRDRPFTHTVDPYEVEYYQQHLYLVGYSDRMQQIADFRLDQIDLASFRMVDTPREQGRDLYPYQFCYRLSAKLARRGISERFHQQQLVQRFEDGSVEIAARARSQFYALRGLLRYAENARATYPPELVAEARATLDAMRALYED